MLCVDLWPVIVQREREIEAERGRESSAYCINIVLLPRFFSRKF